MKILGLLLTFTIIILMIMLINRLSSSPAARAVRKAASAATRETVVSRVHSEYPADADAVLWELDTSLGPESNRVKMDILILSAGSRRDLKQWIRVASTDFRDVIWAAEYSDSKLGSEILRTFREL